MHIFGTGLGFRRELIPELASLSNEQIDFFEIAPENWMCAGGRYAEQLRRFTERFPFACHGLSLSIGSSDPLDIGFIQSIKRFMQAHGIELYTEHLSWCSYQGHLYDLLPIPFTFESVQWVASRVKQVQDILEMTISLENASYYFRPPGSDMEETDFIQAVVREAGCGLHLDINNVYVNSQNFGFDPYKYLEKLPLDRVNYLHVAGHHVENDGFIVDTHGAAVIDPVWQLLADVYPLIGNNAGQIPTCLERDFNFPKLDILLREVAKIRSLQQDNTAALHISAERN